MVSFTCGAQNSGHRTDLPNSIPGISALHACFMEEEVGALPGAPRRVLRRNALTDIFFLFSNNSQCLTVCGLVSVIVLIGSMLPIHCLQYKKGMKLNALS